MFTYFIGCQESELVSNGKLLLERFGDAAIALSDCTLVNSQCIVTRMLPNSELGAGVCISPIPADGSPALIPAVNACLKWVAIESGIAGTQALIGFDPSTKFSPEHLRRRRVIGGPEITEMVGETEQSWIVPLTRNAKTATGGNNPYGRLGTRWRPAGKGEWERSLDKCDQAAWDHSCEVKEFLAWYPNPREFGPRPQWHESWHADAAIKAIGFNYRLGRAEVLALTEMGVSPFGNSFCVNVLHAFTGFCEWEAWISSSGKVKGSPKLDSESAGAATIA